MIDRPQSRPAKPPTVTPAPVSTKPEVAPATVQPAADSFQPAVKKPASGPVNLASGPQGTRPVDRRVTQAVDTVLPDDATPEQRERASLLVQEEVSRLGGVGDSGVNAHAIPGLAVDVLNDAGIPTRADQEVVEAVDGQLDRDATPAERRAAYDAAQAVVDQGGFEALDGQVRQTLQEAGVPLLPSDEAAREGGDTLSAEEKEEARELARDLASHEATSEDVAEFLRDHPDAAEQGEFWREFFSVDGGETGAYAFERLDYLDDPALQEIVGHSLANAINQGVIRPEDIALYTGGSTFESNESMAKIIAATGNPEVIQSYVGAELEVANGDGRFEDRAGAAAIALGGLSPEQFQEYLQTHPDSVNGILEFLPPDSGISHFPPDENPAIASLLERSTSVSPPTAETLRLVEQLLPKIGDNGPAREAVADFFIEHQDALLARGPEGVGFIGPNGALEPHRQQFLSELFAVTLFTEPRPSNAGRLEEAVGSQLREMQEAVNAYGDQGDLPTEAHEQARTLGSFLGTVEAGFQVAVDRIEQKNEAIDGAASLFKTIGGLVPDLPFPGGGLIKDQSIDRLVDFFADRAKENPQDAREAIPFHLIFGSSLENGALATDYDAARSEAFINSQLGLTNPDED